MQYEDWTKHMQSINEIIPFAPMLFGGILVAGGAYIILIMFLGGSGDLDIEFDVDAGADIDASSEAVGFSLNVLAAFAVGVGTVGFLASLSDWSWLLTLISSLLFGAILGRILQVLLNFAIRSQGGEVIKESDLLGAEVRVTVNIPAGKIGEGMIEEPERMKYAIRNIDDEPLNKGDFVRVIDIKDGRLFVRK